MATVQLALAPDTVRTDLTAETAARIAADTAEAAARAAADAAIIAAGVEVASTSSSFVTATGTPTARTLSDRAADDCVRVSDFGTLVPNSTGHAATNWAIIQSAIDYAIYTVKKKRVVLPDGCYYFDRTINVGSGGSFACVTLEGQGIWYYGKPSDSFGGTLLAATFCDRMAINIGNGREVRLKNFSLYGMNRTYLDANGLGAGGALELVDGTVAANWVDPAILTLNPDADSVTAPYAGVAVDAYYGSAPATRYPDPPDSPLAGVGGVPAHPGTYGTAGATDRVSLESVCITGFVVGYVTQPSGADGNGDFHAFYNCYIWGNKVGISICQTQNRSLTAYSSTIGKNYIGIAGNQHGKQLGCVQGGFYSCNFDFTVNLVSLAQQYSRGVLFAKCFAEQIWRLGDANSNTDNQPIVEFNNCDFSFQGETVRELPGTHFFGSGKLVGGQHNISIPFHYEGTMHFDSPVFYLAEQSVGYTMGLDLGSRIAYNGLAGIMAPFSASTVHFGTANRTWRRYFSDVSVKANPVNQMLSFEPLHVGPYENASRSVLAPIWRKKIESNGQVVGGFPITSVNRAVYNLGTVTKSGITFSFDCSSFRDPASSVWPKNANTALIDVGDVVYDSVSKNRFYVKDITANVMTLQLLHKFEAPNGLAQPFTTSVEAADISLNTGYLHFACCRIYTVTGYVGPVFGDSTATNVNLTNIGHAGGILSASHGLVADDYLYSGTDLAGPGGLAYVSSGGNPSQIVAVTAGTPGSIQMSVAMSKTRTQVPLNFWIRKTS